MLGLDDTLVLTGISWIQSPPRRNYVVFLRISQQHGPDFYEPYSTMKHVRLHEVSLRFTPPMVS